MKFAIIGAGLIGNKRAAAIRRLGGSVLGVMDTNSDRAETLAREFKAQATSDVQTLLQIPELEAVIVATSNNSIPEHVISALRADKHVLMEKPAGRNPEDLHRILSAAKESKKIARVGFNHRFHPGLEQAKQLLDSEAIGPLMYFRARYGHGGRKGYDREWRANPDLGGGGELLDQGVHLIDLCRWLGGDLKLQFGHAHTFFWDMPVEDNGFLFLQSATGSHYAWLHASCTEWKNIFDFEIFGRTGKLQVMGLGGSYGSEELRLYRRPPEGGVPVLETFTYPPEDLSWDREMKAFIDETRGISTDLAKVEDAVRAVELVYDTYRASQCRWAQD